MVNHHNRVVGEKRGLRSEIQNQGSTGRRTLVEDGHLCKASLDKGRGECCRRKSSKDSFSCNGVAEIVWTIPTVRHVSPRLG